MGPADGLSFLSLICAASQHCCPYELSSRAFRSFLREKVCPCSLGCKALPVSDARRAAHDSAGYSMEGLGTPTQRLKRPWWVEAALYTSAAGSVDRHLQQEAVWAVICKRLTACSALREVYMYFIVAAAHISLTDRKPSS